MLAERLSLPSRHGPLEITAGRAIAVSGLVVLGGIVRVYGSRGDLWLDEIWSLVLLEPVKSFGQIIWGINSDNNHVLNSMYLYMIGGDAAPILLRGMSIVLGIASVVAAGLILRRDGILGALCAMLLFAVSYPVVHYGSEARGYSGLILFALLSVFFCRGNLVGPAGLIARALALQSGLAFFLTCPWQFPRPPSEYGRSSSSGCALPTWAKPWGRDFLYFFLLSSGLSRLPGP
jgi:hypothetical protein